MIWTSDIVGSFKYCTPTPHSSTNTIYPLPAFSDSEPLNIYTPIFETASYIGFTTTWCQVKGLLYLPNSLSVISVKMFASPNSILRLYSVWSEIPRHVAILLHPCSPVHSSPTQLLDHFLCNIVWRSSSCTYSECQWSLFLLVKA